MRIIRLSPTLSPENVPAFVNADHITRITGTESATFVEMLGAVSRMLVRETPWAIIQQIVEAGDQDLSWPGVSLDAVIAARTLEDERKP